MRHLGWAAKTCQHCGAVFRVKVSDLKWTPRLFCGFRCFTLGRRKRVGAVPREEIARLYRDEGLTMAAIAGRYGLTLSTIFGHLKKAGVPRRPSTGANLKRPETRARQRAAHLRGPASPTYRHVPLDRLVAEYLDGIGCTTLGGRYGVSPTTITRKLRQAGVPIRAPGFGRAQAAADSHTVQSGWERMVDDWLSAHGVDHAVSPRIPGTSYGRADFYAKGHYVEVWGVEGHAWYDRRRAEKVAHYRLHGLPLIEVTPAALGRGDFSALGVLLDAI